MGQTQSSARRSATTPTPAAEHQPSAPPARTRDDPHPHPHQPAASLQPPALPTPSPEPAPGPSSFRQASRPAVPRGASSRSLSQRLPKLSLRSRRRSVGIEELGQAEEGSGAPLTKRRWLRSLRSSRPNSTILPAAARSHSHSPGEPSGSKRPDDVKPSADPESEPPADHAVVAINADDSVRVRPPTPVPSAAASSPIEAGPSTRVQRPRVQPHNEQRPRPRPRPRPTSAPVEPAATPAPQDAQAQPRPPPASSLIIVQGIVHTQDPPPPSSSPPLSGPTNAISASSGPMSGLRPSSLLRRRRSARSPSRHSLVDPSGTAPSPSGLETAAAEPTQPTSAEEAAQQLSESSIEVLGTLLSFATAATAASLVTGSIDPLFHSGLAQAPGAAPSDPAHGGAPAVDRSRRLRTMLGGMRDMFRANRRRNAEDPHTPDALLGELARAINAGLAAGRAGVPSEAVVAGPAPATAPSAAPVTSQAPFPRDVPAPVPVDPVNLPLPPSPSVPEFARDAAPGPAPAAPTRAAPLAATNAPLGPAAAAALDTTSPAIPPAPQPPPQPSRPGHENSFERFLHNLQTDLRTALTEDYARPTSRAESTPPSSEPSTSSRPSSASDESASSIPVVMVQSPSEPDVSSDEPALGTASAGGSTPQPTTQGNTNGQAPSQGINWWRLYRFPPTRMPAGAALAGAAQAPTADTRAPGPAAPSAPSQTPAHGAPTPAESAAPADALVVPVIVVGLQSVSALDAADILPPNVTVDGPADTASAPPAPAPQRREPTLSRAARALNRLSGVMGRSDAASTSRPSTPAPAPTPIAPLANNSTTPSSPPRGGRTYLIYVIGGYYPLNHSIVTGDLNSFEALWQLADLLGQVKPPVASKEDIEKSGLEVFKADMLPKYADEGKVALNTVERCLVCLDDYADDDELRLLSCRHVFHKTCVDKWLETGKNNCPACRAKGVRTAGEDEAPSTSATEAVVPEPADS
ncbi:hypothetical protein AURDEDRAFT_112196 [Auricularia subglabra TFB-10046 SS5]|nr:hypothetical protein AURDEDRAFT_112196 [Auricularia subglabra TFB-10046 SS5]